MALAAALVGGGQALGGEEAGATAPRVGRGERERERGHDEWGQRRGRGGAGIGLGYDTPQTMKKKHEEQWR